MKRLTASGVAIAAALALGACGGGGGGGGSSDSGSATVAARQLPGVGNVLVDSSGKALYTSDQERSGTIVCSGACTAFWKPLKTDTGTPARAPKAGKLGVIKRPDGSSQVTSNGRPLYTFSEDSPGKATGDGFADDFQGHHFTWHVVRAGGKTGAAGSMGGGTASGGDAGSSRGNYGY
jgi:predicted lipoprotein with Yx(FWY)xxD motif